MMLYDRTRAQVGSMSQIYADRNPLGSLMGAGDPFWREKGRVECCTAPCVVRSPEYCRLPALLLVS